jgi:hypothetical protein
MTRRKEMTVADLEALMISYLADRGMSAEYIRGYLEGQRLSGWLRPNCPEWIRNSAAMKYQLKADDR